jgi:hypothetical protein
MSSALIARRLASGGIVRLSTDQLICPRQPERWSLENLDVAQRRPGRHKGEPRRLWSTPSPRRSAVVTLWRV